MGWMLWNGYIPLIKQGGENWWRICASSKEGVGRSIRMVGFSFVCGVGVLSHIVYANRDLFL
jgi:hypothetical protein